MPHKRFRQADSKYVYGVLVDRVTDGQENPRGKSPHHEIIVDVAGTPHRVAVNVRSVDGSNVLAYFDAKCTGSTKFDPPQLATGLTCSNL